MILEKRLKKQKDFDNVFNKGIRLYSKTLTLIFVKSADFKMGISLGKKHGKAHVRNRIKRLLKAAFSDVIKLNPKKNDYHIVLLPKISEEYSYKDFSRDILYLLKKGDIV